MKNSDKLSLFRSSGIRTKGLSDFTIVKDELLEMYKHYSFIKEGGSNFYYLPFGSNTPDTTSGGDTLQVIDDCEDEPDTLRPPACY